MEKSTKLFLVTNGILQRTQMSEIYLKEPDKSAYEKKEEKKNIPFR